MAIREVLQLGNPLLRERCTPVGDPSAPEVAEVASNLADTLTHCRAETGYGRGIAAPQIGALRCIVFLNVDRPWVLINPSITACSADSIVVWDACLSFLCIFFRVERYRWVAVRYQDMTGAWHEVRAEGDLSELLQHEIDHLDGVLALDRVSDIKAICTREEFERRYRPESPYAQPFV